MSDLTLALLRRKRARTVSNWRVRMQKITDLLVGKYGTPSLGNFRDPIKEIFFIVLSAKTTESLYKTAHKQLWTRFSTLSEIANASASGIHECISLAGLGTKRSVQLREIARRLIKDFGPNPGTRLRKLSAEDAFEYLCGLPGVGYKSAFCVMMYSLAFDVFPVDTHVNRVLGRIGLLSQTAKHYFAQEQLPAFVPNGRSKELHVALVIHGREICTPRNPSCHRCIIQHHCKQGNHAMHPVH